MKVEIFARRCGVLDRNDHVEVIAKATAATVDAVASNPGVTRRGRVKVLERTKLHQNRLARVRRPTLGVGFGFLAVLWHPRVGIRANWTGLTGLASLVGCRERAAHLGLVFGLVFVARRTRLDRLTQRQPLRGQRKGAEIKLRSPRRKRVAVNTQTLAHADIVLFGANGRCELFKLRSLAHA